MNRYQNSIETLKILINATKLKKITWVEDDSPGGPWYEAQIGDRDDIDT